MSKLERIKDIVNYQEDNHIKAYFMIDEGKKDDLIFSSTGITYQDHTIDYQDIDKVSISMCSRLYNPGVIASGPVSFIKKAFQQGALFTVGPMNMIYSIDFDVLSHDQHYLFESYTCDRILDILYLLQQHGVTIEDPIQIMDILKQYPQRLELQKYLDKEFPHISKQYHLQNPRGIIITNKKG